METGEIEFDDDVSLMCRVQRFGDSTAFALLAARYRGPLKRFFAALLPYPDQSDDFAQETLLRLWLIRERYRPTGNFSAFVFQIARHFYLNQRIRQQRKVYREIAVDAEGALELCLPPRTQPEAILLEQFDHQRRRRAIAALPEHYKIVFELSHFEGLTYAEIAVKLGIPIGTIKSRMAEAVRRLRQTLTQEETSE